MSKGNRKISANVKIRRAALRVITVCLALIAVIAGWKAFTIIRDYRADKAVYDNISEKAVRDDAADDQIDFEALREINPDVIGWLRYEGTVIDYPVVQGEDNETYLSMLFDRTWGGCGTLFADCITEAPFRQFNTIVYGHHMKDGTMFACLKELRDPEYCREHPVMELFTPEGNFYLRIWAFLNEPSDSDIYITNISAAEDKESYIEMTARLADYTADTEVTADDRLVILSTCAYEFDEARYIVVCKMEPR